MSRSCVRIVLAGLAFSVGMMGSLAKADPACSARQCSDELFASGLTGNALKACLQQVTADCRNGICSCTGGTPPCSCVCGDALCGPSEDCATCPQDCGACCGNGTCEPVRGEDCGTCPQDCGGCCGNGACEASRGEDCGTCPQDCGSCCGNALCEASRGEDCTSCPTDCGVCCEQSGFPTCGGVCPPGLVCQAAQLVASGDCFTTPCPRAHGCACVQDIPCSAVCPSSLGVCPAGQACTVVLGTTFGFCTTEGCGCGPVVCPPGFCCAPNP